MLQMTEEPAPPVETPAEPEQPSPPPHPGGRAGGAPRCVCSRFVVAIVAGALVTFFTIDLGPHLRERAEREGTNYMQRPLHIGRLSAKLTPGVFVVDDIVIEGLEPGHRPFLKAKKIEVVLPWWSIFTPEADRSSRSR